MNSSCNWRRMSGSSAEKGSSIKQHIRVGSQRAGKAHPLLHAARQLMGEFGTPCAKFHDVEDGGSLAHAFVLGHLTDFKRHGDIVQHGPVRHQREILEDHTDLLVAEAL